MVAANAGQADWGHWVAFAPWVSPLITSHPPEWLRGSGSLHSPTLCFHSACHVGVLVKTG